MKPRTSRPRAGGKLPPVTKTINVHIEIELPISIITPKISARKTNSIFYAGKNIAEIRVPGLNRTYVLTTAGEYEFRYLSGRKLPGSPRITGNEKSACVARWTDKDIEELDMDDISTWGWFGINIWQGDTSGPLSMIHFTNVCLDYPVDTYSTYDEALEAFQVLVQQDIKPAQSKRDLNL